MLKILKFLGLSHLVYYHRLLPCALLWSFLSLRLIPRQKLPFNIKIFELIKERETLRKDIEIRTERMFESGLIDEVRSLRQNFPHSQALKAIGIKEIIAFLDGEINKTEAKNAIIKNTMALAKRQRTFNRTQFGEIPHLDAQSLESALIKYYESLNIP